MNKPRDELVEQLRAMARRGETVAGMFDTLRSQLGPDILAIMDNFRAAFHLSLAEVKPVGALSRTEERNLLDKDLLEQLMAPVIARRRSEWDSQHGVVAQLP